MEKGMEKDMEKQGAAASPGPGPTSQKRDLNLDLIRAVAGILVVSLHFLWNSGFYYQTIAGRRMLLVCMARMGMMTCVPLFLLLSGYLCGDKKPSGRYFMGLHKVVLTYLLCSLACLFYRWHWLGEEMSFSTGLDLILKFEADKYSWYIEMYIGLFLLIPFLNLMWKGIEGRRTRLALVVIMLLLTSAPSLANLYRAILPDWWMGIYPLTYYILGLWLRTEKIRVKPLWGVLALALCAVAGGAVAYSLSRNAWFTVLDWAGWAGFTVAPAACLLFLLLRQLPLGWTPGWLAWLIRKGSQLSLGIYLMSWCFDEAYYPKLLAAQPEFMGRLPWFFVMVPAVYLSSALAAQGIEWVRRGIVWCVDRAFPKLKSK